MDDNEKFMFRALLLAAKGEGKVSPNPLVGAVVVKNGKIIGEGYHGFFGGPHAEVNALAGVDAKGATLYITLEPCSHSGTGKKTPPCVPLIIKKGIKRVVIAAQDKNPEVKGIEQLKFAGIKVKTGVLAQEAEEQNEAFLKYISTGKPFVALKMAHSANGKIGIKGKGRVWLSGKEFDAYSQSLRNRYDAILVGINTVLADNPRLTCRVKGGRNPVRIIVDSHLRTPLNAKVLHNAHEDPVGYRQLSPQLSKAADRVIIASVGFNLKKEEALKEKGAHVLICGKKETDLRALIDSLPSLGIYSVLIEGGAQVAETALKGKLADKAILAVSKKKIEGKNAIPSPFRLSSLPKPSRIEKIGEDEVYTFNLYSK